MQKRGSPILLDEPAPPPPPRVSLSTYFGDPSSKNAHLCILHRFKGNSLTQKGYFFPSPLFNLQNVSTFTSPYSFDNNCCTSVPNKS